MVSRASATSSPSGLNKFTIVSESVLDGSASQNKGIRSTLDPGKVKQFYAHTIAILTKSHSIHSRPKKDRKRQIMSVRTRPPIGPVARRTDPKDGKQIPGEGTPELWGATMYDLFRVLKLADIRSYSSITTGSRMLTWVKSKDERDKTREWKWAQLQINIAQTERDPEELKPVNIAELIKLQATKDSFGVYDQSLPHASGGEEKVSSKRLL